MVLCVQFIRSIAHGLAYLHTELPGVREGSGSFKYFFIYITF